MLNEELTSYAVTLRFGYDIIQFPITASKILITKNAYKLTDEFVWKYKHKALNLIIIDKYIFIK